MLSVNSDVFAQIRAANDPGNPNLLSDAQITTIISFAERSPTLKQQLESIDGAQKVIQFGDPGAGTSVAVNGNIVLDPNDYGFTQFAGDSWRDPWLSVLAHEGWHATSPEPNSNTLPSFQAAGAQGVREEGLGFGNQYVVEREINQSPGEQVRLIELEYKTAIELRLEYADPNPTTGQIMTAAASVMMPIVAQLGPSNSSIDTNFQFYGHEWEVANSAQETYPPIDRKSLAVIDVDGDGVADLASFKAAGAPGAALLWVRDLETGDYSLAAGNSYTHITEGGLSTSTWSIASDGQVSVVIERPLGGKLVTLTYEAPSAANDLVATSLMIDGATPTNAAEALDLINGRDLNAQDFATRVEDGRFGADAQAILAYDPSLPSNAPTGPVIYEFILSIDPDPLPGQSGASDPGSAVNADDSTLYDFGGVEITGVGNVNEDSGPTAIANYTLTDNFRPGNANTNEQNPVSDYGEFYQAFDDDFLLAGGINTGSVGLPQTVPADPLVLDLNGDGVKLTDYGSSPVLFDADHDGNDPGTGTAPLERTGWVDENDGIVVHDLNANGVVDGIHETLSEYYTGNQGAPGEAGEKPFANGLAALASLDATQEGGNADGVFDASDAKYADLRIWVDANHDGSSFVDVNGNGSYEAGTDTTELKTLAELGIVSIALSGTSQSGLVRDGNEVLATATFTQNVDGEGLGVPVGTPGSTQVSREAVAASFLADPSGHTFAASGTGLLTTTEGDVKSYGALDPDGESIDVAAKGVQNAYGAEGNDTLTGDATNNWLAGGLGSDVFSAGAGDDVLLIDAADAEANIHAGDGMDIVQVVGDSGVVLNLSEAEVEIVQGGRGDDIFIGGGRSSVFVSGAEGDDILIGGAASDALSGEEGDDLIDGGQGNDIVRGHRGADVVLGGSGDDLVEGGLGEDSLSGGSGNWKGRAGILGFPRFGQSRIPTAVAIPAGDCGGGAIRPVLGLWEEGALSAFPEHLKGGSRTAWRHAAPGIRHRVDTMRRQTQLRVGARTAVERLGLHGFLALLI